ncbi:Smr/MutS family protein [Pseudogemmobacter humi]|uniref:Smr domain-containing protein n=1 Tax=Pseudogemmobacter humi TaxID=2483812 RepID=A0A3P5WNA5_9RHOB|nr:Smr/MutS family protein [Pseudogemmobacter humi]VDC23208.1 hypothetical protein XINFAN_00922 [Pseudogemmobacter humi]
MARRRQLRPEERELWQAVARTARPLRGEAASEDPSPEGAAPAEGAAAPSRFGPGGKTAADVFVEPGGGTVPDPVRAPGLPRFRLGERSVAPARTLLPQAPSEALRMDSRTHQRMTRGKLVPEARLDLHGMTLSEAHAELIPFLLRAQAQGLRLVLVITGKGKAVHEPVPRPMGALRHQVPQWMRLPPLSSAVLQVSEAHLKHGGAGAFYVYLRRR